MREQKMEQTAARSAGLEHGVTVRFAGIGNGADSGLLCGAA